MENRHLPQLRRVVVAALLVMFAAIVLMQATDGARSSIRFITTDPHDPHPRVHTRPMIMGEAAPDRIPDTLAYVFLLQTVAHSAADGISKARAYLVHVGALDNSTNIAGDGLDEDQLYNKTIAIAAAFDERAKALYQRSAQNVSAGPPLEQSSRASREVLAESAMAEFRAVLGPNRSRRVDQFIRTTMKKRITIVF